MILTPVLTSRRKLRTGELFQERKMSFSFSVARRSGLGSLTSIITVLVFHCLLAISQIVIYHEQVSCCFFFNFFFGVFL